MGMSARTWRRRLTATIIRATITAIRLIAILGIVITSRTIASGTLKGITAS